MIALLRICALAVVMVVSLSSPSIREDAGRRRRHPDPRTGLRAACLFLSRRGEASSPWSRTATVAIDVALIAAWIRPRAGAGAGWTLYLIVIVAVALRFGIVETVGVAVDSGSCRRRCSFGATSCGSRCR